MKLMLFDVDLTLVSTGGAGIRALSRAFEAVIGFSGALDGVVPNGKTDPAIIREVCRNHNVVECESRTSEILDCYLSFLDEEVSGSDRYRILPGVARLIEELSGSQDTFIGLATGNIETAARIKLERGGLNRYFPFGGFGSDSEDRTQVILQAARQGTIWGKSPLDPNTTFVIGDTPMDVAAGKGAGFRTVAVATGGHSIDLLEATGADLVISDFERGRDQFLRSTRMV